MATVTIRKQTRLLNDNQVSYNGIVTVFWNVTPCSFEDKYRRFGGILCLHFQGRKVSFLTLKCNMQMSSSLSYLLTNQDGVTTRKTLILSKITVLPFTVHTHRTQQAFEPYSANKQLNGAVTPKKLLVPEIITNFPAF